MPIHIDHTLLEWRHSHPQFDILRTGRPTYKMRRLHVTVLDNIRFYDPAWPNCSTIHSIIVFMCDHCSKDNGLHILRTSLYRRQTRTLWSHPLPNVNYESIDQLNISAFESNGLILVSTEHEAGQDLLITDLRSGRMISLDLGSLFPSLFFVYCFAVRDDGSELGDRKNSSSIYLRLIYYDRDPGNAFCYGHALVEVPSIDGSGSPQKLSWKEHFWPAPWKMQVQPNLVLMSGDRVVIGAKFSHPVHGDLRQSIIWDPNRRKLMIEEDADLVNTDRPLRLFTQRFQSRRATVLLNDTEAIALKGDWSIWRTSFQPSSLKSLSLEKIFGSIGKKLDKLSAHDWFKMTGVDLRAYFEGKRT